MKKLLFTLLAGLIGFSSFCQTTTDDGKSLIEAYIGPLGKSLGTALNNGWYNTARPHKLLGFDATVSISFLNLSNEQKSFDPNSISNFSSSSNSTPTILGKGNGAIVDDIIVNANISETGFRRSFGVMVNYLYELKNIEKNHEDYVNYKKVIFSDKLKKFV